MRQFHVSHAARTRYDLDGPLFGLKGGLITANLAATRRLAARMNEARAQDTAEGAPILTAGELHALGLLHEVFHAVLGRYDQRLRPGAVAKAVDEVDRELGEGRVDRVLERFGREFPDGPVPLDHAGEEEQPPSPGSAAAREEAIEELLLIALANGNPAAEPFRELFDDRPLAKGTDYPLLLERLEAALDDEPSPLPGGTPLIRFLRSPATASPTSLAGQLRYIHRAWAPLLGELGLLDRLLIGLDVIAEEERALHLRFGGGFGGFGGLVEAPSVAGLGDEPERFSADSDWMPRVVMMAKSTYVWLDQLSRRYERDISRLDAVPDEELDRLASWGVTGLWLIGLWQRSKASERIKRLRGNPDAVASAYSLDDYRIADDLGGEGAFDQLKARAWARGIRMASDMVPNHMGIDSRWVIDHPEWFMSLPDSPYPSYQFGGPDLSDDERVGIFLEDHYYDNSDAAVVFRRLDRWSGENRFIYHGNDGTSFPWNDTAQLDYLKAEVREAVIRTILDVARRSPIIRFDAAMVLAKKHVQRLWYPEPGAGGAIPSRAEHALPKAAFDAAMPTEFWRDVVDRVAAEVPDTLLLAEAFWLLEGYFVRTLGMHRVYNSAFMHMLRDEDNAGYRRLVKETLEFDPEILKRYVNFMSNPDEKTAVEQFGKGDKYFGVASVLATIPGLPMLGHGQVEGFGEKYGMEFRRATLDEQPDPWLVERHERELFPLFHRRGWFAGAEDFTLFDFVRDDGGVDENVLAYANGRGPTRSLVVYHNRFGSTAGRLRDSAAFAVKQPDGSKRLERRSLADALELREATADDLVAFRDARSGLQYLRRIDELRDGLWVRLDAYQGHVFWEFRPVTDSAGIWRRLADRLGGGGVPSLDDALREQELEPVYAALRAALARDGDQAAVTRLVDAVADATDTGDGGRGPVAERGVARRRAIEALATEPRTALHPIQAAFRDPWHRAVLDAWALLESLGALAEGAMVGPTSRAWFDELRLAPVVAGALRGRGLDEGAAWSAAERIRVLLDVARPSNVRGRSAADRASRLVDAWLTGPSTRAFLRVNRWEGEEWLDRDAWRELTDWTVLLDVVDGGSPARLVRQATSLVETADRAGYNVARLRSAVSPKAAPAGRTRSTSRRPTRPRAGA